MNIGQLPSPEYINPKSVPFFQIDISPASILREIWIISQATKFPPLPNATFEPL